MARLMGYLLETSERFGMETRTELILLQRTMVVVEGVARSIDPHTNIWEAAKPVVEGWIRENLGPARVARDLAHTVTALTRLGPRLPDLALELVMLAEDARIRRRRPGEPAEKRGANRWAWLLGGVALGLAAVAGLLQIL
jgi:ubiquinone biosynthesis protein